MLEISVSAIKGGFRDLYQTGPNAPRGMASAIRPDSGSPFAVGQEAYLISYLNTGLVCAKCKIIRDVLGSSRVGNIVFSVFIPVGNKLSGNDIKTLLNNLLNEYCQRYIDENNNLGNVYEDWSFVQEIASCFSEKIKPVHNFENYQQGTAEAAFVYYSSVEELDKYFDAPYQGIYSTYRLVFFVEESLENTPQNPLNALRHNPSSNLTGQIDLKNPKNTLLNKENTSKGIKHAVKEVNLQPITKITSSEVKDKKSNPISDTEISYKKNYSKKEKEIISIETKDHSTISAKKDDISNKREPVPKDEFANSVSKERKTAINNENTVFSSSHSNNHEHKGEKGNKTKFIIGSVVVAIVIVVLCLIIFSGEENGKKNLQPNIAPQITQYLEGIKLNLDMLNSYKEKYCDNGNPVKDKPDYCTKLDSAIFIFTALKNGDIDDLKSNKFFNQNNLPEISIDYKKTFCDELKKRYKDEKDIDKSEVVSFIKDFQVNLQKLLKIRKVVKTSTDKKDLESKKGEIDKIRFPIDTIKNKIKAEIERKIKLITGTSSNGNSTGANGVKIKNSGSTPDSSNQNLPILSGALKKEFWDLIRTYNKNEAAYTNLLKKYYNVKEKKYIIKNPTQEEKDIISFLTKICKNPQSFDRFTTKLKSLDAMEMSEIKTLTLIDIN